MCILEAVYLVGAKCLFIQISGILVFAMSRIVNNDRSIVWILVNWAFDCKK